MSFAFVFPGQGSQTVGMGREFIENFFTARYTLQEVDEALSHNLTQLILKGPAEELNLTKNTQPALLAISLAILRTLEKESHKKAADLVSYMAGHSLGEYSALCAAGAFSLSQASQLVRLRGQAMQEAVPLGYGAMAAILGLNLEQVENLLVEHQKPDHLCVIANDNAPGQVVISGHTEAVHEAMKNAMNAKRAVLLPVSAPFHCPLMQPAAEIMYRAFEQITFRNLDTPVVLNVTAMPTKEGEILADSLVRQVTGRVRWRESIQNLASLGCHHVIELGSGKVLAGLIKRIVPDLKVSSMNTPEDLDKFLKENF